MDKEFQYIEYKSSFNEDVIETLVAFANSKGGRVLVGVDNNGQPQRTERFDYPTDAIREVVINHGSAPRLPRQCGKYN
jgi:predicted HTH transcriptional regulator